MSLETPKRKLLWAGRVISILISLMFLMSSVMKMMGGPEVAQAMSRLGLPESMIKPLAILEIACVLVYLIPMTSVLGAIFLTAYLGGAICAHWRVGDPYYTEIALGIFIWLGLYVRERRLRDLVPVIKPDAA